MELPRQLTPFIGRQKELAEIHALLADAGCHLLTIAGVGGAGKTRLALQAAAQMADHFAGGVHFVPLQALTAAHHLAPRLAEALHLSLSGQRPAEEQLIAFLQEKELLLVLDNFEHLVEEAALLSELLYAAPRLKLLVTSREVLSLQEEWVYRVGGMQAPAHLDQEDAAGYEAVQLFSERVRRANPRFSLQDEEAAVIAICQLVEGIPLALEVAASWAGTMSCEAIATEIQNNLDFLASNLRNVPERHRSMRAVFDQSWKHLTPDEQAVFCQLSVFRGPFRRQAAEEIAGATLPTLSALVNKSLLQWDVRGHYHLHELLRQYAEEQLMASPAAADVRERHCAYFARFLRQRLADIHAGRQIDAMAEMEAELDNLRAAWQWAAANRSIQAIRDSVLALAWFWQYQSRYQEAAEALYAAITPLEAADPDGERGLALAELLVQYGWICIRLGRLVEASAALQRSQSLYERIQAAPVEDGGSDPLSAQALLALFEGDAAKGISLLEEARRRQEARGDRRNLATSYYLLTSALVAQGRWPEAETSARRAHHLAESLHDRWSVAYTLNHLGQIAHALGRVEEAREHQRTAYAIRRQYQDREGMALSLRHLAEIALHQQEWEEAERLYGESLALYEGTGDRGGLASVREGLGNAQCGQGKLAQAAETLRAALQTAAQIQLLPLTFSILTSIASLLIAAGDTARAFTLLAYVANHPATPGDGKARAAKLLQRHSAAFATEEIAAGVIHVQDRELEHIVAEAEAALAALDAGGSEAKRTERSAPLPRVHAAQAASPHQPLVEALTPRELEVLQLMAAGLTNQEIGAKLIVALGTVKAYTSRIYGKLGVQNRVQAIERARTLAIL